MNEVLLCKVDDACKSNSQEQRSHIYRVSAEEKYSSVGDSLRQPSLAIMLLHRIPRHIAASGSPYLGNLPATRISKSTARRLRSWCIQPDGCGVDCARVSEQASLEPDVNAQQSSSVYFRPVRLLKMQLLIVFIVYPSVVGLHPLSLYDADAPVD